MCEAISSLMPFLACGQKSSSHCACPCVRLCSRVCVRVCACGRARARARARACVHVRAWVYVCVCSHTRAFARVDVLRFECTGDALIRKLGRNAWFRIRCLPLQTPQEQMHRLWSWRYLTLKTLDWMQMLRDDDHVMLSDIRDVLIQGDIFAAVIEASVCLVPIQPKSHFGVLHADGQPGRGPLYSV